MKRAGMWSVAAIAVVLGIASGVPEAAADELSSIVRRIAGGASILSDISSSDAARDLHESAHHLERVVDDEDTGRRHLGRDWRRLRDAYRRVDRERDSDDPRVEFLVRHLGEDVAAGDRVVGRDYGDYADDEREDRDEHYDWSGGAAASQLHARLLGNTVCLGWNRVGSHPCPSPQRSIDFRLPHDVTRLRRISGEWRDYGRGAKAVVLVNGAAVWESDVAKDWDGDSKDLDLRVPRGSTITVVSKNGDPMWVRRLEVDYQRD
jgi:hypothetical protein